MSNALGTNPDLPNYGRAEYVSVAPDLLLIEHELGGTRAMHAASTTYIRKWEHEKQKTYDFRRTCESFFEGLGRTLSAGIGMLFAKPPAIVWNGGAGEMEADFANIDAAGTAGPVFVKRFAQAAVRDGFSLILVDHPSPPKGVAVHAGNERDLNLRPVWSTYPRGSIINWDAAKVNNVLTPTLIVAYEPATVRKGAYGTESKHLYRVFRLEQVPRAPGTPQTTADTYFAHWELWEMKNSGADASDFAKVNEGVFRNRAGELASRIPISVAYTGDTNKPFEAKIPLLGVAWANLSHWQLSTDLRFNTVVASFAQPVVTGDFAPQPGGTQTVGLQVGPLVYVHLKEGGDFKWVEAAGTGLARLAALVLEKLQQMGALGVSFLMSDTRAAETAEAKRLDAAAENATLATAAQAIEDAVNVAFEWDAWYRGIPKESCPVMTLSRDYENVALGSDVMLAYVKAVSDAEMPVRVLLQAFQQGGRIPSDTNLEELEAEMMAGAAAIADAQAEAANTANTGAEDV